MGIHPDLFASIQHNSGPLGYLSQCVGFVDKGQPAVPADPSVVVLVDLLCRFYAMSRLMQCTTDELVDMILRPWFDALTAYGTRLRVFVACIDQTNYKTLSKKRHSRNPSSDVVPYPEDARFTSDGICLNGSPVAQPIEIDRLLAPGSRHLRHRLWFYVHNYIQRNLVIPENTYFIFDYEVDVLGPMVKRGGDNHSTFLPHHAHQRAEADLAFPYWTLVFGRDYPVVWHTIDSDVLVVGIWLMAQYPELKVRRVIWRRPNIRGGGDAVVHLSSLASLLSRGFSMKNERNTYLGRFTYLHWMLMCILSGTDYTDKKYYTHQVGIKALAQAICSLPSHIGIEDLLLSSEPVSVKTFSQFMIALSARVTSPDIDRAKRGLDFLQQYQANKQVAVQEFNDLLVYWRVQWDNIPFQSAGRLSISSLEAAFTTSVCKECITPASRQCKCENNPRGWWNHDEKCRYVNLPCCVCPSAPAKDPMLAVTPIPQPLSADELPPILHMESSFVLKGSSSSSGNKRSSQEFIDSEYHPCQRPRVESDPLFLGGFDPAHVSLEDGGITVSRSSSSQEFPLLPLRREDDTIFLPGIDDILAPSAIILPVSLFPLHNPDVGARASSGDEEQFRLSSEPFDFSS